MLPLVSVAECASNSNFAITENMFCAGYAQNFQPDTCEGDSGGGLLVKNKSDAKWYLTGIISWGEGCSTNKYGVYTRVDKYLTWISNTTLGD